MSLEYGYTNEHEAYVRPIENDAGWVCVLCGIQESTLVIDDVGGATHIWFRYGLACHHQAHETCYRKWTERLDRVGCPTCGPLEKKAQHQYCGSCHEFGHPACP